MNKGFPYRSLKLALSLALLLFSAPTATAGQFGVYQHGTVVRMRMGDCAYSHRGFRAAVAGPSVQATEGLCPEYTMVSDKVVYVIVGKSSNQLIPLADVIDFRLHNNELAVRIDDARHESKFSIKEMILRSEWDMVQKHIADQLNASVQAAEGLIATRSGR